MSKSDLAQEAARHLRELILISCHSSEELLNTIAQEYEIEANVLRAWLLRDFASLEALDAWAATRREEIKRAPELERMRITNLLAKLRQDQKADWQEIERLLSEIEKSARKN